MLGLALCVSACGGGGGSSTPAPSPTSTPQSSCAAPTCAHSTSAVSSATATTQDIAIPELGGISGVLTLPFGSQAQDGTLLDVTLQTTPEGIVALDALQRRAASVGTTNAQFYLVIKPSRTITLPAFPSFTFLLSPTVVLPSQTEYLAYYNGSLGTYQTIAGPVTVSGNRVSFTGPSTPLTLVGGQSYVFVLYGSVAAPVTGHPVPAPSAVEFNHTGQTQIVTVSEPSYTGTFTATSSNTSIVGVAPLSGTSFLLTAGTSAGGALVIVSDSAGRTWVVDVGVTLAIGTVR